MIGKDWCLLFSALRTYIQCSLTKQNIPSSFAAKDMLLNVMVVIYVANNQVDYLENSSTSNTWANFNLDSWISRQAGSYLKHSWCTTDSANVNQLSPPESHCLASEVYLQWILDIKFSFSLSINIINVVNLTSYFTNPHWEKNVCYLYAFDLWWSLFYMCCGCFWNLDIARRLIVILVEF